MIGILRKEIKNVAGEKIQLEERYKSKLLASFGSLRLSKTRATERKNWLLTGTPLYQLQFSIETWREKNYSL